jgi:hypothetical protein
MSIIASILTSKQFETFKTFNYLNDGDSEILLIDLLVIFV